MGLCWTFVSFYQANDMVFFFWQTGKNSLVLCVLLCMSVEGREGPKYFIMFAQ
jgi:hypothetical protein